MKHALTALCCVLMFACNNDKGAATQNVSTESSSSSASSSTNISGHWEGSFSNGMKGAIISFDISEDGKELKDLTFQGYWRCDGKLELTTIGPEKGYTIKGKAVDGTVKESGFYFELHGTFNGNKASGTLRFAFVAGGCDTYKLNWTAEKQ